MNQSLQVSNQVFTISDEIVGKCIEEADKVLPGWRYIHMDIRGEFYASMTKPIFCFNPSDGHYVDYEGRPNWSKKLEISIKMPHEMFLVTNMHKFEYSSLPPEDLVHISRLSNKTRAWLDQLLKKSAEGEN